ncbi:DUF7793 family protein [Thalassovita mangrovi]|uniref:DUF7793 domain-containing protein n=1 Tax=Thalassovita mangrovi TaxID=2692236 RepID=A0A6L8LJK2_9RHOB|nr:hypothetical protein [Thalassovita mangrovi]MYM56218.1 hypothetical protein [Thalassovita mangrovi]
MKKTIDTKTARTTLGDDGIVRVRMRPNTTEDCDSARENIAALTEICGGKKRPLLIDMAGSQGATHDARLQYSGEAMSRNISAEAMLVTTPVTKVVGRFFVSLNKPRHLLRLFSSEPEAVAWLRQYRQ